MAVLRPSSVVTHNLQLCLQPLQHSFFLNTRLPAIQLIGHKHTLCSLQRSASCNKLAPTATNITNFQSFTLCTKWCLHAHVYLPFSANSTCSRSYSHVHVLSVSVGIHRTLEVQAPQSVFILTGAGIESLAVFCSCYTSCQSSSWESGYHHDNLIALGTYCMTTALEQELALHHSTSHTTCVYVAATYILVCLAPPPQPTHTLSVASTLCIRLLPSDFFGSFSWRMGFLLVEAFFLPISPCHAFDT